MAALLPYLEDLSISIEHIDSDFNVLLNALPSSLKVPSLQGQVQVVTDVTWDQVGHIKTPTHKENLTACFTFHLRNVMMLRCKYKPGIHSCRSLRMLNCDLRL